MRKGTILLISFLLGLVLVGGYIIYDQNKVNTNLAATNEELIEQLNVLTESNNKMYRLNEQYVAKLQSSNAVIEELKAELQTNKDLVEELLANADVSEETIAELQTNINTLNELINNKDLTIESLEEVIALNNSTIESLQNDVDELVLKLNEKNALYQKLLAREITSLTASDFEGVTKIGPYAFYNLEGLESVEFSNDVVTIANNAFSNCANLETVVLGNSVATIGNYAFEGCNNLSSVKITAALKTLGDSAFVGNQTFNPSDYSIIFNSNLTAFNTDPETNNGLVDLSYIESIGDNCFNNRTGFDSIKINNNIEWGESDYSPFQRDDFQSVEYQTSGESYTFNNGMLTLLDGFTSFAGFTHLATFIQYIDWGNCYVERITEQPFAWATSLKELDLPEGVTSLEYHSLSLCKNLESITLPSTITRMYHWEPSENKIKTITIKAATPPTWTINSNLESDILESLEAIYVPANSVTRYKSANVFSNYSDKIFAIPEEQVA